MNRTKDLQITKNKYIEFQVIMNEALNTEWFVFSLETRSNCDHRGIYFRLEVLKKLYLGIVLYDKRHVDEQN